MQPSNQAQSGTFTIYAKLPRVERCGPYLQPLIPVLIPTAVLCETTAMIPTYTDNAPPSKKADHPFPTAVKTKHADRISTFFDIRSTLYALGRSRLPPTLIQYPQLNIQ